MTICVHGGQYEQSATTPYQDLSLESPFCTGCVHQASSISRLYNYMQVTTYVKVHVFKINSSCKESNICNHACKQFSIEGKICFGCLNFNKFQFLLLLSQRVFLAFGCLSRNSFKRFLWRLNICSKVSACILSCLLFQRLYIAKGRVVRCITRLRYLCIDTALKSNSQIEKTRLLSPPSSSQVLLKYRGLSHFLLHVNHALCIKLTE